eukprot:scaffold209_cov396-Prasinococcus_capsulatus_cf.AAC.20
MRGYQLSVTAMQSLRSAVLRCGGSTTWCARTTSQHAEVTPPTSSDRQASIWLSLVQGACGSKWWSRAQGRGRGSARTGRTSRPWRWL